MIKLHLREKDLYGSKLKQELTDLRLAFESELHPPESGEQLPAVEESGKIYSKREEIDNWLIELKAELKFQRSLTGDGCYIDPETGEYC